MPTVAVTGDRLARLLEALDSAGDRLEQVRLVRVYQGRNRATQKRARWANSTTSSTSSRPRPGRAVAPGVSAARAAGTAKTAAAVANNEARAAVTPVQAMADSRLPARAPLRQPPSAHPVRPSPTARHDLRALVRAATQPVRGAVAAHVTAARAVAAARVTAVAVVRVTAVAVVPRGDIPAEGEGWSLTRAEPQGDRFARRGKPGDRRGPRPDADRRGPRPDADRRGPRSDADRRGPRSDARPTRPAPRRRPTRPTPRRRPTRSTLWAPPTAIAPPAPTPPPLPPPASTQPSTRPAIPPPIPTPRSAPRASRARAVVAIAPPPSSNSPPGGRW